MEGRRRNEEPLRWLLLFGAIFIALFAALAATVGFGSPRIPAGDVAVVEGAPPGEGTVSKGALRRAVREGAAATGSKAPEPGSPEYKESQRQALSQLLTTIWLAGQAEELGLPIAKTKGRLDITKLQGEIEPKLAEEAPDPSNPQPYFTEIDFKFPGEWLPRTHCRDDYVVEQCSSYVAGHPLSPCFEAHPTEKVEACPAPAPQRVPAQPGTYTAQLPNGNWLPQGPVPAGG